MLSSSLLNEEGPDLQVFANYGENVQLISGHHSDIL